MEEVKEFGNLEEFVTAFSEAGKALSEVKIFGVQKDEKSEKEPIKVIDGTKVIKEFFETFMDDETKNLVNKFSGTTTSEKIDMLRDYHDKLKMKESDKVEKGKEEIVDKNDKREIKVERRVSPVSDLVQKERDLNARIAALSPADRKEYYAKLYQIPTEKDLHLKLDLVLEKLEDLSSEVAIIRRHLYTK